MYNLDPKSDPQSTFTIQDMLQLHSYLVSVPDPSPIIKETIKHVEDCIHTSITAITVNPGAVQ